MNKKRILIIGHTFPEPTTTAAGGRMLQLIQIFSDAGFEITFACTAAISENSEDLSQLGVSVKSIALNNPMFDDFIKELQPSIVLYDRFMTEEQFGWRVSEFCQEALQVLDTEDLHFLRKARAQAVKENKSVLKADLFTETAKRELASILRCDLSLIISEYEIQLLTDTFHIPKGILEYLPLLVDPILDKEQHELPSFEQRAHFMTIGNLLHAPNVDSVLFLKHEVWPALRAHLPHAEMHIYGAYAPQQVSQLHKPSERIFIKGWAPSSKEVMSQAKVCLAPLRFGAGLKGKLVDAMHFGLPSVTTSIGAEGLCGNFPFNGMAVDTVSEIVAASVALYTEKRTWELAQGNGFKIIENRFQKKAFSEGLIERVMVVQDNLFRHRNDHFMGQILKQQTLQASKYMSKWIEAKNK